MKTVSNSIYHRFIFFLSILFILFIGTKWGRSNLFAENITQASIDNNIALSSLGAVAWDNGYFDDYGVDRKGICTIDEDEDTYWAGLQDSVPQTLWIQFDRFYDIDKIQIIENNPNSYILTGTIEYFDGTNWHPLLEINKSSAGYYAEFEAVETNQIVLKVTSAQAPGSWYNEVACIHTLAVNAVGDKQEKFNFVNFSSIDSILLVEDAQKIDELIRLTSTTYQSGAMWYKNKLNVADGFKTEFQFRIDGTADGLAFVIQNDSLGTIGGRGRSMGYDPIPNSLAVEFDIFNNAGMNGEPDGNHISVHTRGVEPNSHYQEYSIGYTNEIADINDGNVHLVRILYTPGMLEVYFDDMDVPVLEVPVSLSDTLNLDMGKAWIGFTSGTMLYGAQHNILSWMFEDLIYSDIERNNPSIVSAPSLLQNFPNPFNPVTNIVFALPKSNHVKLIVYNILGQKIATLLDKQLSAGEYTIQFNAQSLPSGLYIYRLESADYSESRRMYLLK